MWELPNRKGVFSGEEAGEKRKQREKSCSITMGEMGVSMESHFLMMTFSGEFK